MNQSTVTTRHHTLFDRIRLYRSVGGAAKPAVPGTTRIVAARFVP